MKSNEKGFQNKFDFNPTTKEKTEKMDIIENSTKLSKKKDKKLTKKKLEKIEKKKKERNKLGNILGIW